MSSQITNVIPMEPAETAKAAAPAVLNRAAWPNGSLLACAIVSHRFDRTAANCPVVEEGSAATSNAA